VFIQEFTTIYHHIEKMPAGDSKKALHKFSDLITDPDETPSEILDVVIEGMMDLDIS